MTKLEDFKRNQEILISTMKLITGGKAQTSEKTETVSNGCGTCTEMSSTDTYEDCNGNGKWDHGESGSVTHTFTEVECP